MVGAGASGMAAAIMAARAEAQVALVEATAKPGRSILASGNGRCNLANMALGNAWQPSERTPFLAGPGSAPGARDAARLPGAAFDLYNDPAFAQAVVGSTGLELVLSFFDGLGLLCVPDEEGRIYPASRCASSVLSVLTSELARLGVNIVPSACVSSLDCKQEGWSIGFEDERSMRARAVVWAAGGASGQDFARLAGLKAADSEPVLCPLACAGSAGKRLDGVRAACVASLQRAGKIVAQERGEVLFRPYGVSGIVVFDLSRHARPGDVLALDLRPGRDDPQALHALEQLVDQRLQACEKTPDPAKARLEALDGILNPQLGRCLMEQLCGANGNAPTNAEQVLELMGAVSFEVRGPADAQHAQVTRGGVLTSQIDAHTMAVCGHKGLFACGEALDVDAACGGFNLAWAWLSGMKAGSAAALSGVSA